MINSDANYLEYNIVVLDDDEETRKIIVGHLERAAEYIGGKCNVFECSSAYDAWTVWKNNKIHGILTEIYLGDSVTGIDFIQEINKDTNDGRIPMVILTGNNDPFRLSRYWDFAQVLQKPVEEFFWKKMVRWLLTVDMYWRCIDGICQIKKIG